MPEKTAVDFGARWTQTLSAFMLCISLLIVCAQPPLQIHACSPASQVQNAPAQIELNGDEMGTTNDVPKLRDRLADIFKQRKARMQLTPGTLEVEKSVFVKAERTLKLGEAVKVIGAVEESGASPVQLPIEAQAKKAGEIQPSMLMLVVSVKQPNSSSPPSGKVISGGISVVLSGTMRRPEGGAASIESLVMVTIPKDGEFTMGDKRVEKAALEREIREWLKGKPEDERALFIKGGDDITYGSVEDVAYAANAAGVKLIYMVAGGQTFSRKEEGVSFTVPAGWNKDESSIQDFVSWNGPEGVRLSFDAMYVESFSSPEIATQQEYELRSKLQKEGQFEEVRYLELDGVKGLLTRSVDKEDDASSVGLTWVGYRRHGGKLQLIHIFLTSPLKSFNQRQYELYGILHSTKFAQS